MPIESVHTDYLQRQGQWTRVRDAYAGYDAVKARRTTYLPVLEGQRETDASYTNYLARALFYPVVERTVTGLSGMVLRKLPTVGVPDVVAADLSDVTLADDPWEMVLQAVTQEILLGGRVAILVDWQDEAEKPRPFWTLYATEALTNWREGVVEGQRTLTRAILREQVADPLQRDPYIDAKRDQYREFELTPDGVIVRLWHKAPSGQEGFIVVNERVPTRGGEPLRRIPLVVFGPAGLGVAPEKPPLLDVVDLNLSHYRTSADYEHGLHFTALPTPWIAGWTGTDEALRIGSGAAWMLPDPNAKVGMLEFTGQGLTAVEQALRRKEQQMATVGARLLESQPSQAETAEAVRLRHSGDTATLGAIADSIGLGLEAALRWHAWWYGQDTTTVSCRMSHDFLDARLSAQEATALMTLWQGGGISRDTLYWNLQQGEWARPNVTLEEEVAAIEADDEGEPTPAGPTPTPEEGAEEEEGGEVETEEEAEG